MAELTAKRKFFLKACKIKISVFILASATVPCIRENWILFLVFAVSLIREEAASIANPETDYRT